MYTYVQPHPARVNWVGASGPDGDSQGVKAKRARFSLLGSGECSRHSAAGDSELGWAPNAQKQFCLNQLEALISRPPSDLILLGRRPFYTTSLEPCVPISCIYVYRVLLVTA